ncbi:ComF family protein [Fictibacillus sp. KIGAM418]|uniref:ComF family protein n=1 Tax=Fictibacillus marinisediminis TaxID=2878389 RepID=A0A9X2BE77_9BACL|nr:ComF family protein [Fictibacillus marinisediminis]MCK6258684.1 ComF family protein [Fictibacillus marinisediminis]
MNYCLYCDEGFYETVSWSFVLGIAGEMHFCEGCSSSLERIEGEICEICGRSFSLFPEQYRQENRCNDCIHWEEDVNWRGVLVKNRSLYVYNDFLKELISRLKYRGDAELVMGFRQEFRKIYQHEFKGFVVVPVPLSQERHYERGFNQTQLLAELLGVEVEHALERVLHEKKQSKKSRQERLEMKETIFELANNSKLVYGKSVVLVDDVYTTGATLRQASRVLKEGGALQVSSMTLGR